MFQRRFFAAVSSAALLIGSVAIATPAPIRAQDDVYLEENFEDDSNGWDAFTRNGSFDIADNVMTVEVTKENTIYFVTPDQTFPADVTVSVDVKSVNPESELWTGGIIVRTSSRNSDASFYEFDLDGSGDWVFAIRTEDGDTYETVERGSIDNFDAEGGHRLSMTAEGSEFILAVDGEEVGTVENSDLENGDDTYVGLIAGAYEGLDNITVEFSNVLVTAPGATGNGGDDPDPTETPEGNGGDDPVEVGTPIELPFAENFRNNDNGWDVGEGDNTAAEISRGALRIEIINEGFFVISKLSYALPEDFTASVELEIPDGDQSEDWNAGIAFRLSDDGTSANYLQFEITGGGDWLFLSFDSEAEKKFTTLDSGTLDDFDGASTFTLQVTATGDRYSLSVNGERVSRTTTDFIDSSDESFRRIGLVAGTFEGLSGQSFLFSNFTVEE